MANSYTKIPPTYNSLVDPNLQHHFSDERIRKHLQRAGLINRHGQVIAQRNRERKQKDQDFAADIKKKFVEKTVENIQQLDRMRQAEFRDQLEQRDKRYSYLFQRNEEANNRRQQLLHTVKLTPKEFDLSTNNGRAQTVPSGVTRQHTVPVHQSSSSATIGANSDISSTVVPSSTKESQQLMRKPKPPFMHDKLVEELTDIKEKQRELSEKQSFLQRKADTLPKNTNSALLFSIENMLSTLRQQQSDLDEKHATVVRRMDILEKKQTERQEAAINNIQIDDIKALQREQVIAKNERDRHTRDIQSAQEQLNNLSKPTVDVDALKRDVINLQIAHQSAKIEQDCTKGEVKEQSIIIKGLETRIDQLSSTYQSFTTSVAKQTDIQTLRNTINTIQDAQGSTKREVDQQREKLEVFQKQLDAKQLAIDGLKTDQRTSKNELDQVQIRLEQLSAIQQPLGSSTPHLSSENQSTDLQNLRNTINTIQDAQGSTKREVDQQREKLEVFQKQLEAKQLAIDSLKTDQRTSKSELDQVQIRLKQLSATQQPLVSPTPHLSPENQSETNNLRGEIAKVSAANGELKKQLRDLETRLDSSVLEGEVANIRNKLSTLEQAFEKQQRILASMEKPEDLESLKSQQLSMADNIRALDSQLRNLQSQSALPPIITFDPSAAKTSDLQALQSSLRAIQEEQPRLRSDLTQLKGQIEETLRSEWNAVQNDLKDMRQHHATLSQKQFELEQKLTSLLTSSTTPAVPSNTNGLSLADVEGLINASQRQVTAELNEMNNSIRTSLGEQENLRQELASLRQLLAEPRVVPLQQSPPQSQQLSPQDILTEKDKFELTDLINDTNQRTQDSFDNWKNSFQTQFDKQKTEQENLNKTFSEAERKLNRLLTDMGSIQDKLHRLANNNLPITKLDKPAEASPYRKVIDNTMPFIELLPPLDLITDGWNA
ncbi:unnamed protein product [Didymodactylos carnosus]|uniref:Uncharacterized protein n=1 Tax=Didymodactylos carnosus TaxID=1234261 RepID=A0A815DIX8_9BILA|nr:unnamed protein product [Didymodactylos carnosus]CAF1301548.1 unnamed protein product [Didymodactylos carnosus]CAF3985313.1 unnamed protein product [Didymodactylos carnosus]CAF4126691.1 unnamed protein product [Didymodactylos carnosus]